MRNVFILTFTLVFFSNQLFANFKSFAKTAVCIAALTPSASTTSAQPLTTSVEPLTTSVEPLTTSVEPLTTSVEPLVVSSDNNYYYSNYYDNNYYYDTLDLTPLVVFGAVGTGTLIVGSVVLLANKFCPKKCKDDCKKCEHSCEKCMSLCGLVCHEFCCGGDEYLSNV